MSAPIVFVLEDSKLCGFGRLKGLQTTIPSLESHFEWIIESSKVADQTPSYKDS